MARRNLLRSLLAASVMVVSGTTGLLVAAPAPAGAIENPDHRVTVYETRFDPPIVYAGRGETVQFDLAPGVSTNHTVTLDNGTCGGRPAQLCERTFEDPDDPPVFRFFDYGEYRYHDRIAREAGQHDMGGQIIVTDTPPRPAATTTTTTPPTTTTQPTTTTTRPVTTTTLPPSSTTTTAPSTIHPFVITDPPTTTTAAPIAAATPPASGGDAAPSAGKDPSKDKGKGKGKAASTGTATTNTSPLPDGPIDVVFDAESLTPLPDPSPTDVAATPDSDSEEAALLDLLSGEKPAGDKADVLLAGVVVLALLGLAGGLIAWYHRSSRYFPA